MFKITCFVKILATPRGLLFDRLPDFTLASAGRALGEQEGVEGWWGEPSVVL